MQGPLAVKHALQALSAISSRELFKFSRQYGRLVSALVRPLLWLAVFAAGFRNVFGVAIVEPYDTYIPYDVYIVPGLLGMVLLVNGMQSSLAMVYDREMGLMRLLLTDGQGVIGQAPADGMLHPKNTLDTLGADAPEKLCKARSQ